MLERGSQVKFRFDPKAERVLVDRVQVQQLLVNLLRNAHEAMTGGKRHELDVSSSACRWWMRFRRSPPTAGSNGW